MAEIDTSNEWWSQLRQNGMIISTTVLNEILDSITQSADMVQQIASSSEEQSAGAEYISSSVEEMNSVTKQTSDGVGRIVAAAEQLDAQTLELNNMVNKFKLN